MNCEMARAAISEAIDGGEQLGPPEMDHLEHCAPCRNFQEGAHRLRRATIHPIAAEDPISVRLSQLPKGFVMYRWARFALAWAAVMLIIGNIVGMFSEGSGTAIHLERHQAAFDVALGLAFLFVAWRTDRAYGMVPFAATFVVALSVAAIIDLVNGASTLVKESEHLIELTGLGFLWWLGAAVGPGRRRRI